MSDGANGKADGHAGQPAEDDHQKELALIEACYAFPCEFSLSVIARNEEAVVAAILAAAATTAGAPHGHERQPSSGGKYISHRLRVHAADAHEAHEVRRRLRALDGVLTVL